MAGKDTMGGMGQMDGWGLEDNASFFFHDRVGFLCSMRGLFGAHDTVFLVT